MYNRWFMRFAPKTYKDTRVKTTKIVIEAMTKTDNMADIGIELLSDSPGILPTLRMSTCPPLAVDRLIGLAGVSPNLVRKMEGGKTPPRMRKDAMGRDLSKINSVIKQMIDPDIFTWVKLRTRPSKIEIHRAATIVADRLCGSLSNPIIRNAQEKRQLGVIKKWLSRAGYKKVSTLRVGTNPTQMMPGTFSIRQNIQVRHRNSSKSLNLSADIVVMPRNAKKDTPFLVVEAKSAGDFTNVNKRRKEEAVKIDQLQNTYGSNVKLILFLCGYFDTGYLGYEAAAGLDWVWEHRMGDFSEVGL